MLCVICSRPRAACRPRACVCAHATQSLGFYQTCSCNKQTLQKKSSQPGRHNASIILRVSSDSTIPIQMVHSSGTGWYSGRSCRLLSHQRSLDRLCARGPVYIRSQRYGITAMVQRLAFDRWRPSQGDMSSCSRSSQLSLPNEQQCSVI